MNKISFSNIHFENASDIEAKTLLGSDVENIKTKAFLLSIAMNNVSVGYCLQVSAGDMVIYTGEQGFERLSSDTQGDFNAISIAQQQIINEHSKMDQRISALESNDGVQDDAIQGLIDTVKGVVTTLPTPSSEYRGRMIVLQNNSTGDKVYVCVRKVGGAYAWMQVPLSSD